MKKLILLFAMIGVTVCLKEGYYFQDGSQCKEFEQGYGAGAGAYIVCFGDYSDTKVCVPVENILSIEKKNDGQEKN